MINGSATTTAHENAAGVEHIDLVDEVTPETLRHLTDLGSPCVSLLLPTRRDNPDRRHDALLLRSLIEDAAEQLRARGVDPEGILAPVSALVADSPFWGELGDGLAVFADRRGHHVYRLPRTLEPTAQVGDAPRLTPLVPVAAGDEAFHVLALSQNQVRLFAATRDTIREMGLGPVPASMEDMERAATREPELQHRHQPPGRGTASFHGHGGSESSGLAVDKFIKEVAAGLRARLGAHDTRPLVVAAVAEHLPALQATRQLPTLLDEAVTGNPENLRPDELLQRAWPIVKAQLEQRRAERGERFVAAHGTGTAISDPAELRRAAEEGRVATILVRSSTASAPATAPTTADAPAAGEPTATSPHHERPDESDDIAVAAALKTGADVAVADLPEGVTIAAMLRY